MTLFEDAMLGVNGAIAAGLHRRHGWRSRPRQPLHSRLVFRYGGTEKRSVCKDFWSRLANGCQMQGCCF